VWDPGGESLVFARAKAQDPNPPGRPAAKHANDPDELQIRYDLCRIPFRGGRGGKAEPVAGASGNGMSNTFPKISPDGKWLVYVQSRNGQLMRPDSRLYIVPAQGGEARRMNCNTALMNSWHSFSPNGRWLVFSSKARSPYTQMYLTHIDADGTDTPPVLVEDATAANRAVNLPEFVNLPPGGLQAIGGPALDYYRFFDRALYLQRERRYAESAEAWKALLAIAPGDAEGRKRLGMVLLLAGKRAEALPYLEKDAPSETALARAVRLLESGQDADAVGVAVSPNAQEQYYLGLVALRRGDKPTALSHLREAISLSPNNAGALRRAAWILATDPRLHDGAEALRLAVRAAMLTKSEDASTLAVLAAAYAEKGRFEDAEATAQRALPGADPARKPAIERQIERYRARMPWRE
jgi:tetratricopeptide (TPR) repeat protein